MTVPGSIDPRVLGLTPQARDAMGQASARKRLDSLDASARARPTFTPDPVTLGGLWLPFGGGYGEAQELQGSGLSYLQGMVKCTATMTFGNGTPTGSTICTVDDPPGFDLPYACPGYSQGIGYVIIRVDVRGSGLVTASDCLTPAGQTTMTVDSWVSLAGIAWQPA